MAETTPDEFDEVDPPAKDKIKIVAGRYRVPFPGREDQEGVQPVSRVTTVAKAIEDTYLMDRASERKLVWGLAQRPDLVESAAIASLDDRKILTDIVGQAFQAAMVGLAASEGTNLHALAEHVDAGRPLPRGTRKTSQDSMAAYQALLRREGIRWDTGYSERLVTRVENGTMLYCGRLDRMTFPGGIPGLDSRVRMIGDLKSGKSMEFGALGFACQLAMYANATHIWNPATERWDRMPEMATTDAFVVWIPVGQAKAELFHVDITAGWEYARLAMAAREARVKGKGLVTPLASMADLMNRAQPKTAPARTAVMAGAGAGPEQDGPVDVPMGLPLNEVATSSYEARIQAAKCRADLSAVWRDASQAGLWTPALEQQGMAKMATLSA